MFLIILLIKNKHFIVVLYISLFYEICGLCFRMGGLYVLLHQVMEMEMKQEMRQGTL